MTYWVYILQSESNQRYYCGYSSNVQRRVNQHNDPKYRSTRTTKVLQGPWKAVWTQKCASRSQAVIVEKKLKNIEECRQNSAVSIGW